MVTIELNVTSKTFLHDTKKVFSYGVNFKLDFRHDDVDLKALGYVLF